MSTVKKKHRCDEDNSNDALVVKKKKKSTSEIDYDQNSREVNTTIDPTESYQDSLEATERNNKKKKKSKKSRKEENENNEIDDEECRSEKKKKRKKERKNKEQSEEKSDNSKSSEKDQLSFKNSKSSKSSEEDQSNCEKRPYAGQWSEVNLGSGDRKDKFLRLLGGYKSSNVEIQEKKKFSKFAFSKKKEESLNDNLEKQYETAWSITREKRGLGLGFDNSTANDDKAPSFSWS